MRDEFLPAHHMKDVDLFFGFNVTLFSPQAVFRNISFTPLGWLGRCFATVTDACECLPLQLSSATTLA